MKYMGSKKYMLKNGLGELIIDQSKNSKNFYDPFCGSASVVWFAAKNIDNKIIAGDLQGYAVDLANAVLLREEPIFQNNTLDDWIVEAEQKQSFSVKIKSKNQIDFVLKSRDYCKNSTKGIITKSYGGHYFSAEQSLKFDYLLKSIPEREPYKSIAKSALIIAATFCVASPGHTAQPFQPTKSAIKFIEESWKRDPFIYIRRALREVTTQFSNKKSRAYVSEATKLLNKVEEGDLVFIDPPYSGVHYSRFYHVLETISRGNCSKVSGNGRYPDPQERPRSDYSMRGTSVKAFNGLLEQISNKKASAIITFPLGRCSNGLSGDLVKEMSKKYFRVKKNLIKGTFSTLGGNKKNRPARLQSAELVLLLEPK